MFNRNHGGVQIPRRFPATVLLAATASGMLLAMDPPPPTGPASAGAKPGPGDAPGDNNRIYLWDGQLNFKTVTCAFQEPVFQVASVADIVARFPAAQVRWFKDMRVLEGENGSTLVLRNVGPGDAGCYGAVISNAVGPDGMPCTYMTDWHNLKVLGGPDAGAAAAAAPAPGPAADPKVPLVNTGKK